MGLCTLLTNYAYPATYPTPGDNRAKRLATVSLVWDSFWLEQIGPGGRAGDFSLPAGEHAITLRLPGKAHRRKRH